MPDNIVPLHRVVQLPLLGARHRRGSPPAVSGVVIPLAEAPRFRAPNLYESFADQRECEVGVPPVREAHYITAGLVLGGIAVAVAAHLAGVL